MQNENSIYVVFFSTNTKIGSIIRIVTKHSYNHVAIALDGELKQMYSFSRYHKTTPLVGGFVEESLLRYCSEDGTFSNIKVCRLPVSKKAYRVIKNQIQDMKKEKDHYMYNTFSAMLFLLHRRVLIKKAYICIEFVVSMLNQAKLLQEKRTFYTIEQLEQVLEQYKIYEGDLSQYAKPNNWGNDGFYIEDSILFNCKATVLHFGRLLGRLALPF
ncbi:hypothetical protein [Velocimicrobium porci]|uniref:Uncharacterized protein n=1 Tax=Velocimicrobium porci TaxID=2606634 RepID=A0A6L5XXP0_9FIRM|nr:hypothetical protein [Velocimicrobium porci]MSS63630.1 hypothetical protein [Velocimicrobium porci]